MPKWSVPEVAHTNKTILMVSLLAMSLLAGVVGVAAIAPAGTASGTNAIGVESVSANIPMPLQASIMASASGCTNAPGPTVTLSGSMALAGLGVEMIFQNNADGTHQYTSTSTSKATLIPSGDPISVPKQPVDGGTGGNPWIWFEFTDPSGNALMTPVFLGRCVQGLSGVNDPLVIPSIATATVTGGSCSNTGSTISLSGELKLSGLNALLMFANSNNPVGGPHQANVMASIGVVLIPAGESITFAKQPSLGGVGGNPWIYLAFTDGKGNPVMDPVLLGRCVQNF